MTSDTSGASVSYRSYLLRLWRESAQGAWRASLESVTTGERHGFGSLASLVAFLQAECQEVAAARHENLDEQRYSSKE